MQLPGGITLTDIRLRIARLTRLALGFGRERLFWPKDNDGLHFNEREPYLMAIAQAESACEAARVILAKAEHRLKEAEKAREQREATGMRPGITASPPAIRDVPLGRVATVPCPRQCRTTNQPSPHAFGSAPRSRPLPSATSDVVEKSTGPVPCTSAFSGTGFAHFCHAWAFLLVDDSRITLRSLRIAPQGEGLVK